MKPGSEEWLATNDYSKRLDQLNIPTNILSKINTKQLVKICLNYPQIELVFTRNNLIEGISYISTNFNGFAELFNRGDAGIELLQSYQSFNPSNYKMMGESGRIQHKMDFIILEMILSSPVILNNMNKEERVELLNESYKMYEEKADYWDKFYLEQVSSNLLIMARILEIDKPSIKDKNEIKKDMDILLKSGTTHNSAYVTALINEVDSYLNNN